jgi:hypothetical protein
VVANLLIANSMQWRSHQALANGPISQCAPEVRGRLGRCAMPDLIAKSCGLAIGVGEGMCSKQFRHFVERNDCPAWIIAQLQRGIKSVRRHFKAPSLRKLIIAPKTLTVFDPNQLCPLPDIDNKNRMMLGYKARCRRVENKTLKPFLQH